MGNRSRPRVGRTAAEFVLIVVGVLAALAVDQWVESLEERDLERGYLERLVEDLAADREAAVHGIGHAAVVGQRARLVMPFVKHGDASGASVELTLVASFGATTSGTPVWTNATLQELLSTGGLRYFSDPAVRKAVLGYYEFRDGSDWMYDLMSLDYRDAVRRRIPADVQLAIRECPAMRDLSTAEPCDIPLAGFDVDAYLAWLSSNEEVAGSLNLVMEQYGRAEHDFLPALIERIDALTTTLRAELAS